MLSVSDRTEKALEMAVSSEVWKEASSKFIAGLLLAHQEMITKEQMELATEMMKATGLAAFMQANKELLMV